MKDLADIDAFPDARLDTALDLLELRHDWSKLIFECLIGSKRGL